jgi:hypothetical protein
MYSNALNRRRPIVNIVGVGAAVTIVDTPLVSAVPGMVQVIQWDRKTRRRL